MKKISILVFIIICLASLAKAQCFPERHSTNFFDGWVSCEPAENPNTLRGKGHFIMYDFGKVYKLGQMKIWNSNDPSHLDYGLRDVAIDYSLDGKTWLPAGDFTLTQANGLNTYEGDPGPHLNNVEGQYLLITALNNYGGSCYGISEMRVEGEEVIISDVDPVEQFACVQVTIYPNPFSEKATLQFAPGCSGEARYVVYDELGRELFAEQTSLIAGQSQTADIGKDLPDGSYMLHILFDGKSIQRPLIKVKR
jgi:hypothetical protein